jgi:DNA (cytosine-5)-methyltransferase 1
MLGEADSRGTLFNEIIRIAEVKQPKYMLLENVKGLTCKKFKPTFNKILSELDRIGYNCYWKVLNSKDYGIPQSRARVWFVCFRKDIDTQ